MAAVRSLILVISYVFFSDFVIHSLYSFLFCNDLRKKELPVEVITHQAHDVKTKSYRRWCDVVIRSYACRVKLFSCSIQLFMKFILLINCWHFNIYEHDIYNICEFESKTILYCQHFSFYEQVEFRAHLIWAWKKFYNLGSWLLYFKCILDLDVILFVCVLMYFPHGAMECGWSVICVCGISCSYTLTLMQLLSLGSGYWMKYHKSRVFHRHMYNFPPERTFFLLNYFYFHSINIFTHFFTCYVKAPQ